MPVPEQRGSPPRQLGEGAVAKDSRDRDLDMPQPAGAADEHERGFPAATGRPGQQEALAGTAAQAVAKAEAHMRENLHRPLARAEVAASVGVSEAHLARLFRAATGGGVNKRLTEMRIVRAKELLAESALPVTAIAGQVGFSSFSHFSLLFRRAVGLSPSDYRRSGGVGGR